MYDHAMMKSNIVLFQLSHIILTLSTAASRNICGCKIDLVNLSADCEGLGLTNLTSVLGCIPLNTRSMYLGHNSISEIPDEAFKVFTSLYHLNLDGNAIEYLNDRAFVGLENLHELSIVTNRLHHADSYSNRSFSPLINLRTLSIQGNCDVHRMVCKYPDTPLSHLSSLQDLAIDGIPFVNLGDGFSALKSLKALVFTDSDGGHCNTPLVTPSTFAALATTPISLLNMDGCSIETLLPGSFRKLWNLTKLILTYNRNLCTNGAENATLGLNETRIQFISFRYWCRDLPHHLELNDGMLKGLTNTSLESLVLEYNNIDYVSPDCIDNLPRSIVYFSLKENVVNDAHFLSNLWRLDNVQTFDFSFQNHYDKLIVHIRQRTPLFEEKTVGNTSLDVIKLPRHIKTIYMNNIKLKYPIPSLKFSANELSYIDASECLLLAFLGPWFGLHSLQVLNLGHNLMSVINPQSFVDMPNLRSLYLQDNQLGTSIGHDVEGDTFSKQIHLETLDLSYNGIKDLPFQIFKNQVKLRRLFIAGNSLQNFSVLISSMLELKHLDLSGNEIVDISKENRIFLDRIAANSSIKLDLSNNTLICQCGNIDFMNWLATTQVNILNKSDLKCIFTNSSLVSLERLDDIISQLKYGCTSWIVLTSCISSFVGLTLVLSLVAVVYHKRWQLRYLYYMGRRNLTPYHPLEEAEIELDIDAYISYELQYDITKGIDLHKFIADTLHPKLTSDGFSVKIREELPAGQAMFNVITESVRKTRKLVVFLTPDYCSEYWNTFEFNMAVYEGIFTNRNIIFPIIIGSLSDIHLSKEVQTIIHAKLQSKDYMFVPSAESLIQDADVILDKLKRNIQC